MGANEEAGEQQNVRGEGSKEGSQVARILKAIQQQVEQPRKIDGRDAAEVRKREGCRKNQNAKPAPATDQPADSGEAETFERELRGGEPACAKKRRSPAKQWTFHQEHDCEERQPAEDGGSYRSQHAVR